MYKKFTFFVFIIFIGSCLNAQVGIETNQPTNTLDVNGTVRVRDLPTSSNTEQITVVVANNDGVLKKKTVTPQNQSGTLGLNDTFNTGVNATLYAPVMIKFIPVNAALGYSFTVNSNNEWELTCHFEVPASFGPIEMQYEILWLNRY